MEILVQIKVNELLYLKDPQSTPLGKSVLRAGIAMIAGQGFEAFTFRKLATEIGTTEASVYRYFENKHRFLLYVISLYWNLIDVQLRYLTQHLPGAEEKITRIIDLLATGIHNEIRYEDIPLEDLYEIVLTESNKAYLTKEVEALNSSQFYKPYKDLCGHIAEIFQSLNPTYPFPRSLASTLVEMSHLQAFFAAHLPLLTDIKTYKKKDLIVAFLRNLVMTSLQRK